MYGIWIPSARIGWIGIEMALCHPASFRVRWLSAEVREDTYPVDGDLGCDEWDEFVEEQQKQAT